MKNDSTENRSIASKFSYIDKIKNALTDDQVDMLAHVYEPQVVATPLADSRRDVCIMPGGEIRSYGRLYGKRFPSNSGQAAYLSSRDAGISWTLNYSHGIMNSCVYFEDKELYLTVCDSFNNVKNDPGTTINSAAANTELTLTIDRKLAANTTQFQHERTHYVRIGIVGQGGFYGWGYSVNPNGRYNYSATYAISTDGTVTEVTEW